MPLQRWTGLHETEVPRISRQLANEGGKVVSPMHQAPLPPRRQPWYSFLLEAKLTPGPLCGQKDQVHEKSQQPHWEPNP